MTQEEILKYNKRCAEFLELEKYESKELLANELVLASKTDFIAGATSKYVYVN